MCSTAQRGCVAAAGLLHFVLLATASRSVRIAEPGSHNISSKSSLQPIVIVPGLGGSVLEANITDAPPLRDCASTSDWYTLWFSVVQIMTRLTCFMRNMMLSVDPATGAVVNGAGIRVRPHDFGGLNGVNYMNPNTAAEPPVPYMNTFTSHLIDKGGYVAGKSLRAATYDFRTAGDPAHTAAHFDALRALVEETYTINGNVSVHLVSHSLGGPFTNRFLHTQTDAWRSHYVASFIQLSSPLAGTPVALAGIIAGPVFPYVPQSVPALVAPVIRTFPCIAWMFPTDDSSGSVWGGNDTVFIDLPGTPSDITFGTMKKVPAGLNATVLLHVWPQLQEVWSTALLPPDEHTPVLCIYANDTNTAFTVKKEHLSDISGDVTKSTPGDGTVNLQSLRVCSRWPQSTTIERTLGGSIAAHNDILNDGKTAKAILEWVQRPRLRRQ